MTELCLVIMLVVKICVLAVVLRVCVVCGEGGETRMSGGAEAV